MRFISLSKCHPGMILGKAIYDENGRVLLTKGTKLTNRFIKGLQKSNNFKIYIEDKASEGIDIIESIPEDLSIEATRVITEGLDTIAGLTNNTSRVQSMMKSGRAVRSFQKVFRDIIGCLTEYPSALNLLAATKVHENHVYTHSLNVTIYACQLALENGLPLKEIEEIGMGAMLHDLGKLYIPKEILNKPGKLTNEEYEQVKAHCEFGFDVLRKIHEIPLAVSHCALQHHERIDGKGYPRGLMGDDIHKYAKIISVADVFDAVTSYRVYRPAMLPHKAIELLYQGSGTQFDSKQIKLFQGCVALYPQGLTVKLNDGRTGIVTAYNYNAIGRPTVRIIKDEEQQDVTPYEIDLSSNKNLTLEIAEADTLLY